MAKLHKVDTKSGLKLFLEKHGASSLTFLTQIRHNEKLLPLGETIHKVLTGNLPEDAFAKAIKKTLSKHGLNFSRLEQQTEVQARTTGTDELPVVDLQPKSIPTPRKDAMDFYAKWHARLKDRGIAQAIAAYAYANDVSLIPEVVHIGPHQFPALKFREHFRVLTAAGDLKVVLSPDKSAIKALKHSPELDKQMNDYVNRKIDPERTRNFALSRRQAVARF